jgi:hypothetical protein
MGILFFEGGAESTYKQRILKRRNVVNYYLKAAIKKQPQVQRVGLIKDS